MIAIGLMAGTSLDGISAAVVELKAGRSGLEVSLRAFHTYPYSGETVRLILEASDAKTGTVDKVARLNFYLGELFAEAALKIMKAEGLTAAEVDFIGSHGQTIHHLPAPVMMAKRRVRATLQIAEPSVIAVRAGITTVADFRPADIAAGGEGAPLVPYVDYLLFRHPKRSRFLVNIGGIANGSIVPRAAQDPTARREPLGRTTVAASDIGPGNMVINELVSRMTNFKENYDRDGRHAARGKVNPQLLAELLKNPFFAKPPPKSTGRERFGATFVQALLAKHPPTKKGDYLELIAAATALTAAAIPALRKILRPEKPRGRGHHLRRRRQKPHPDAHDRRAVRADSGRRLRRIRRPRPGQRGHRLRHPRPGNPERPAGQSPLGHRRQTTSRPRKNLSGHREKDLTTKAPRHKPKSKYR